MPEPVEQKTIDPEAELSNVQKTVWNIVYIVNLPR